MTKHINYSTDIPVKYDVEVFVAGGGPAGVTAAISAARNGAKVYIAEGQGYFGGMGTAGRIPVFMEFSDGINIVSAGIGIEILRRLQNMGGTGAGPKSTTIKAEVLKRLYDEMITEVDIGFAFHTHLIGVLKDGGIVTHAILHSKSGIFAVKAKAFIDCTGDGDLSVMAGAHFEKGDENGNMMPGTLCSVWTGINWDKADKGDSQKRMLEKAFSDKVFAVEDLGLPGMWPIGELTGAGNIGHAFSLDSTDEASITKSLVEQRKRLTEYEIYYKKYLQGYEDMELVTTGDLIGARESRRIIGDYILSLKDFHNRANFDDEIGRYCYAIDIHPHNSEKELQKKIKKDFFDTAKYENGESYGIPYRSLVPKNLNNVLTAGRCISCDNYMLGSIRVMPGCFITGQAAGAAAAIMVHDDTDTRGVNIKKLQVVLKKMGAFLPNFYD